MANEMTFLMAFMLWAIAGVLARLLFGVIMGTGKRGGFVAYVLLGVIGASLSGLLFRVLGSRWMLDNWQVNIMAGVVGAVILMVLAEYAQRHQAARKDNDNTLT